MSVAEVIQGSLPLIPLSILKSTQPRPACCVLIPSHYSEYEVQLQQKGRWLQSSPCLLSHSGCRHTWLAASGQYFWRQSPVTSETCMSMSLPETPSAVTTDHHALCFMYCGSVFFTAFHCQCVLRYLIRFIEALRIKSFLN